MTISSLLKKTTEDQERLRILQEDYGKTTEDNFSANFIATLRGHHGKTARRLQKTTWNYDSNLMSLCWVLCTKTWSRRVEVKIYLQVRVRKRVFNSFWIVFLCRFWIFLGVSSLVPFPLYLQQFGAGTCHCAWYLQEPKCPKECELEARKQTGENKAKEKEKQRDNKERKQAEKRRRRKN